MEDVLRVEVPAQSGWTTDPAAVLGFAQALLTQMRFDAVPGGFRVFDPYVGLVVCAWVQMPAAWRVAAWRVRDAGGVQGTADADGDEFVFVASVYLVEHPHPDGRALVCGLGEERRSAHRWNGPDRVLDSALLAGQAVTAGEEYSHDERRWHSV